MEGKFADARWVDGTWDLAQFKSANGETDWDAVIDAEARAPCNARAALAPATCRVETPLRCSSVRFRR